MISLAQWFRFRAGEKEAKAELEKSQRQQESAHRLNTEVRGLHQENQITARVHQAMRGGRA